MKKGRACKLGMSTYDDWIVTMLSLSWIQGDLRDGSVLARQPIVRCQVCLVACCVRKDVTVEITISFPWNLVHDRND